MFEQPELKCLTVENRPAALVSLYQQLSADATSGATVGACGDDVTSHWDASDYNRMAALGATLRRGGRKARHSNNQLLEIETRRPASVAHLREWLTDDEALGEVSATVGPDNRRATTRRRHSSLHR